MKLWITTFSLLILVSSCSRKFSKDYEVVDASHEEVPQWIVEPTKWAEDEDEKEFKNSRYYVYTSEPKTNRGIACKIAEVKAREKVASEISVYIKNSFASSTQGDPTDKDEKMSEYVSDDLVQEVQNQFVGSTVLNTYWEKRKFSKEKGASDDWAGYTCSALIRISRKQLENAFKRANKKLTAKARGNESKKKVEAAVEAAQKEYLKI